MDDNCIKCGTNKAVVLAACDAGGMVFICEKCLYEDKGGSAERLPEEKTCLNCRFEPLWHKDIGLCKWNKMVATPTCFYKPKHSTVIRKDMVLHSCPAWEVKP